MKKKGYMLVGLADKRTGNMVAFNLESAVFEISQKGTSNLLVEDVVYTVDTIELMTLLQGCGVELMHCVLMVLVHYYIYPTYLKHLSCVQA